MQSQRTIVVCAKPLALAVEYILILAQTDVQTLISGFPGGFCVSAGAVSTVWVGGVENSSAMRLF